MLSGTETRPEERKRQHGVGARPQRGREWGAGKGRPLPASKAGEREGAIAPEGARLEPAAMMVVGGGGGGSCWPVFINELKVMSENFFCAAVWRLGKEKVRKC